MAECLYNITYRKEITDSVCELRICQTAICQLSKRHLKAAQYLSGCEQTALTVTQTDSVLIRTFITRSPEQNRHIQRLCQTCTYVLSTKVAVRQEQTVNTSLLKLFHNLREILIIVKKSLFVDIININELNAQEKSRASCGS